MEEQTFVIVGPKGEEYEFPVGMDPKKAGLRVQQSIKNDALTKANKTPLKEPETKIGGWLKSLNDQATEMGRGGLEGMAHPQTAGDFLSLLIPEGGRLVPSLTNGGETLSVAERMAKAGSESPLTGKAANVGAAILETPKVKKWVPGAKQGASSLRKMGQRRVEPAAEDLTGLLDEMTAPEETSPSWVDRYKPSQSGIDTQVPAVTHEKVPYGAGEPKSPPPPPVGRVVEKTPTLEDTLREALEEAMQPEGVNRTTAAPEVQTAGEGSLKQSGKFKRSDSKGQAGGYSSGRPSITQAEQDNIASGSSFGEGKVVPAPEAARPSELFNEGAEPEFPPLQDEAGRKLGNGAWAGPERRQSAGAPPDGISERRLSELMRDKFGGRAAEEGASLGPESAPDSGGAQTPQGPSVDLDTYLAHLVEHDPGAMAGRAQDLRAQLGSRDAARQMFGTGNDTTKGWVRQMAPGPSRLPSAAEERMMQQKLREILGEEE